jgi:hypothetical protein
MGISHQRASATASGGQYADENRAAGLTQAGELPIFWEVPRQEQLMKKLLVCTVVLGAACTACNSPAPRLNAPPHGTADSTSEMQSTIVAMTDNALLADMSISDIHFMPHRAILNGLGRERLSRLASLMEAYGGEIRFSTDSDDERLIRDRTEVVVAFLGEAGIATSADTVHRDMPGGTGMSAAEVILIKANEATYRPRKSGGAQPSAEPTGGK